MSTKKTGIYYVKHPKSVVVMKQGVEIARYDDVEAFITAHQEGLLAVEQRDEKLYQSIASQYDPLKN